MYMKRRVIVGIGVVMISVIVLVIYSNLSDKVVGPENNLISEDDIATQECKLDNDCPPNHKCFNSQACPKGSECEPQSGDLKCHEICEINSDCPSEAPNCVEADIFRGDVGELAKMCFSEKCVEFGKKVKKNQLCCGVVTEEYCVKRIALSDNTCAGAGEWYSTEERGVSKVKNCCEGLVKLHPERVAGYCVYK